MEIRCDSQGWHVVAEWLGEIRVVHRPLCQHNSFQALTECIEYRKDNA